MATRKVKENTQKLPQKGRLQTKMDYAALLKPPPFTVAKVGDPEQLLQDFMEYLKIFKKFVLATGVGGEHTGDHVNCGGCQKTKATLELVGDVRAFRAQILQGCGEDGRRDQEADQPGYCEVQIVH